MGAYEKQVDYFVDMMVSALNGIELLHARYGQHIVSSMLLKGCLERGKDCTSGGAKYDYVGVQGVGIADVGDSLTVIKQMIFDEKNLSKEDFLSALQNDFKSREPLRQTMIHI